MGVWGNPCKGHLHGENRRFSEQVLPRNSRGSAILITLAPDLSKCFKKSKKINSLTYSYSYSICHWLLYIFIPTWNLSFEFISECQTTCRCIENAQDQLTTNLSWIRIQLISYHYCTLLCLLWSLLCLSWAVFTGSRFWEVRSDNLLGSGFVISRVHESIY